MIGTGCRLLLCAFIVSLNACNSGGGSPIRYYLVEATSEPSTRQADIAVELTDLDIPQYLERFQIASRTSDMQLHFSDSHQWAESLAKNLTRTMSRNLSRTLGTPDIGTAINRSASVPDFRVLVIIQQFEQIASGHVLLVARWQLSTGNGAPTLTHISEYRSEQALPKRDYDAIVTEMADLFAAFSNEIASTVLTYNTEAQ